MEQNPLEADIPEASLPCSKEHATDPYPEPDESNPCLTWSSLAGRTRVSRHLSNILKFATTYRAYDGGTRATR